MEINIGDGITDVIYFFEYGEHSRQVNRSNLIVVSKEHPYDIVDENRNVVYTIDKCIGYGTYGVTLLAKDRFCDDKPVVFKYLNQKLALGITDGRSRITNARCEMSRELYFRKKAEKLLGKNAADDILVCFEGLMAVCSVVKPHKYDIYMRIEKMDYDLDRAVSDEIIVPDAAFVLMFIKELCRMINMLHSVDLYHLDIKLDNILVRKTSNPSKYQFKLCDFGFSGYRLSPFPTCYAFGTYIPPYWKRSLPKPKSQFDIENSTFTMADVFESKSRPTNQVVQNKDVLVNAEYYAMACTFRSLFIKMPETERKNLDPGVISEINSWFSFSRERHTSGEKLIKLISSFTTE
jgi:serine/threonine protein kinase